MYVCVLFLKRVYLISTSCLGEWYRKREGGELDLPFVDEETWTRFLSDIFSIWFWVIWGSSMVVMMMIDKTWLYIYVFVKFSLSFSEFCAIFWTIWNSEFDGREKNERKPQFLTDGTMCVCVRFCWWEDGGVGCSLCVCVCVCEWVGGFSRDLGFKKKTYDVRKGDKGSWLSPLSSTETPLNTKKSCKSRYNNYDN